ncbi:MAG: DUF4935 domain-containing protein [Bacteroidetes bacterium]|nr:DUF4935 domain-containing protein [Bacteroidota bacterium]
MTDIAINPSFCFNPNGRLTTDISNRALRKFAEGIDAAIKLEGDLPIILDTNILLDYYGMSQAEKAKLIQLIKTYNSRIYITRQVEQEYLRNRLSVIKKNFFEPLNRIASDFITLQRDIENKLKSYKEEKKRILSNDYPDLWDQLEKIESGVLREINNNEFHKDVEQQVGTTTKDNKNISLIDEMLTLTSSLQLIEGLGQEELDFLKTEFDRLIAEYNNAKETNKWKFAFPGCGEKKDEPYGDFIIFHEILKFMKKDSKSCIFLTNDVTKGDWLQFDKNPHIHYLENSFLQTENIIYIVHAEQTLPNISFENIHKSPLEILSAIYGSHQPEKQIDVTSILKERIANNKLTITASNDIVGDPDPGVVKSLTIHYRIGERQVQATIIEGATDTIPQG